MTGNYSLSADGQFVEAFTKPDSKLLDEHFKLNSSKLLVSPTGYIYVMKGENILTLDAYNRFKGYFGQTELGFNLINFVVRLFASDVQKTTMRKVTASTYINMTIDAKGIIYATSLDTKEGEIKKLNSVGENIYVKYSDLEEGFSFGFGDWLNRNILGDDFIFGERWDFTSGKFIEPKFLDIAVDSSGIITVIEQATCKLYQYDQEANLLTVFGGKGTKQGEFDTPSSMVVDAEGQIYVLDKGRGNIQVFQPTGFIKLVHQATVAYENGFYNDAYDLWNQVLKADESYQLAHKGIGASLYKQGRWLESMTEYEIAENRVGYSKAFIEYRYDLFRANFFWVLAAVLALLLTTIFIVRKIRSIPLTAVASCTRQQSSQITFWQSLGLSLGMMFHPVDMCFYVKSNRHRLNYLSGFVILLLALCARLVYVFKVSFLMADIDLRRSNIWLEAVKLILPIITWIIASYIITSILDGESKFGEVFMVSCYSLVPYTCLMIPLAFLSNVLSRDEMTFFTFLVNGVWVWVLILLFTSFKTINDYQSFKAIWVCCISVLSMLLIWAVLILLYVTVGRLIQFLYGIFQEASMAMM